MSYKLLSKLKAEQAKSNAIIDFKPREEKELAKEIKEAVTKLASNYSDLKDSITDDIYYWPNDVQREETLETFTQVFCFMTVQ